MKRSVSTISLVLTAAILFTASAFAQSEAQKSRAQNPPVQAKPAQAAPVPQAAPQGEVAGKFGDWSMLCSKPDAAKKEQAGCVVFQGLEDAKTKKRVFGQTISYGPQGNLVLLVRGPAGVALQKGLVIGVDGGQTYRAPFHSCGQNICQAVIALNDQMQQEMRKAKQTVLVVHALNGKPLQVAAPMNGFAAALDALAKRRPAAPQESQQQKKQ